MTPLHDWAVVQTFGGISTTKLVLINCCNILIQWTLNISHCFMYHKCGSWPKDNRDRTRGIFSKLCKLNPTQFNKSVETQGLDRFKLPWITRPWIKQRRCLTYQEVAAVKTVFFFFCFFWIEHPPQSWQTA